MLRENRNVEQKKKWDGKCWWDITVNRGWSDGEVNSLQSERITVGAFQAEWVANIKGLRWESAWLVQKPQGPSCGWRERTRKQGAGLANEIKEVTLSSTGSWGMESSCKTTVRISTFTLNEMGRSGVNNELLLYRFWKDNPWLLGRESRSREVS